MPCRVSAAYGEGVGVAQLSRDVVVAAGCGQDEGGLPLHGAHERLVGGGVAGVQGEHDLGRRVELRAEDAADDEVGVDAEPGGELGVVVARLLAHVDPGQPHGQPADVARNRCAAKVR